MSLLCISSSRTTPLLLSLLTHLLILLLLGHLAASVVSIRIRIRTITLKNPSLDLPIFREAPSFRNGVACASLDDNDVIHVAMTLDVNYLRCTMAAVLSMLQHCTCPENLSFHFLSLHSQHHHLSSAINSTFPYLNFRIYLFDPRRVKGKISRSIRQALDQPLNYARTYLANTLSADVKRVIYFDSDLVVVDDIAQLWSVDMEDKVVAAPEYCHANFSRYFTNRFWSHPDLAKTFDGRNPCYFNTGVMVMDVDKWRKEGYTKRIEEWMVVQKEKRIYKLGSLPPFLLVLAGNIKAVDHRWNQHGLGGDNFEGKCTKLHPGPISVLHWSGKGKPWLRLDSKKPCPVDRLWAPYDLYRSSKQSLEE